MGTAGDCRIGRGGAAVRCAAAQRNSHTDEHPAWAGQADLALTNTDVTDAAMRRKQRQRWGVFWALPRLDPGFVGSCRLTAKTAKNGPKRIKFGLKLAKNGRNGVETAQNGRNFRLPDLDGVLVDFAEIALALLGGATSKGTWRIQ